MSSQRAFVLLLQGSWGCYYVLLFSTFKFFFMLCLLRSNAEESYHLAKYQQTENSTTTAASKPDLALYLGIYGGLVVGLFLLSLICIELYYTLTVVASKNLYDKMLTSLMRAPMYFFDNNSIGEDTPSLFTFQVLLL